MHGVKAGKWHGKISLSPHPSIVGVFYRTGYRRIAHHQVTDDALVIRVDRNAPPLLRSIPLKSKDTQLAYMSQYLSTVHRDNDCDLACPALQCLFSLIIFVHSVSAAFDRWQTGRDDLLQSAVKLVQDPQRQGGGADS
jgi:hypothetical protein